MRVNSYGLSYVALAKMTSSELVRYLFYRDRYLEAKQMYQGRTASVVVLKHFQDQLTVLVQELNRRYS